MWWPSSLRSPGAEMAIRIQTEPFDVSRETETLRAGNPAIGAIASFIGYVRDIHEGLPVTGLSLEHYPGMAEKEMGHIVEEAQSRWALEGVRVVHRIGELKPGDPIVFVAVASQHRSEAFAACEFIMDFLKTRAPFWKKQQHPDGSSQWLDARESDQARLEKW
jgi:molybdopterin synthase catalytic subunit